MTLGCVVELMSSLTREARDSVEAGSPSWEAKSSCDRVTGLPAWNESIKVHNAAKSRLMSKLCFILRV